MRKIFFTLSLFFILSHVQAQTCQPDPNVTKKAGVSPDSATNFMDGYAGMVYSQLITVIVPKDTQAFPPPFPPIKFDSVTVASVTGLPASLTYACNTGSMHCSWPGNSKGCMVISGTPSIADTGTHKLVFTIHSYVAGSTSPLINTISYYRIIIHQAQSIYEPGNNTLELHQNYPNPFSGKTQITFTSPDAKKLEFIVYDLLGRTKYSIPISVKPGLNKLDFDSKYMSPGAYFYAIKNSTTVLVRRTMIIELSK